MEKNKKSIIFLIITFICVTTIIIKDKLYFKDDIYVVSKEEVNNKESILANSEDAHDNYEEVNNIKKRYSRWWNKFRNDNSIHKWSS